MGHKGYSTTQMAVGLGMHRDTLYELINPGSPTYVVEFSDAYRAGNQASLAYWESFAQDNMTTRELQGSTLQWLMNNRFPKQYSPRPELGQGAIAIQINLGDKAQGESDLL